MKQDPTNDREFSFEVDEVPSLVGEYTLTLQVSSVDYSPDVTPISIALPVSVRCTDPELIEEWTTPSAWNPNEYDESYTSSLPIYESCFSPYTNLSY